MNSLEKPTVRTLLGSTKNAQKADELSRARRRAGRFSSLRPGKSMVKSFPTGKRHLVVPKALGALPLAYDSDEKDRKLN